MINYISVLRNILIVLSIAATFIYSQDQWEKVNLPGGGNVSHIFIRENGTSIIRVEINEPVSYYFSSQSQSWELLPNTGSLRIIGEDFQDNLYSVRSDRRFFRSTDAGISWAEVTIDGIDGPVSLFLKDTINTQLIAATRRNIYYSNDNGLTWKTGQPLPQNISLNFIGVDLEGYLYVKSEDKKIFKKNPDTELWIELNLSFQFNGPMKIFNDTIFLPGTNSIYMSTDGGNSWFSKTLTILIKNLEKDNIGNFYLIAQDGLYKCTGSFTDIRKLDFPFSSANVIHFNRSTKTLIAGTNVWGVVISSDYGESWTGYNEGLNHLPVDNLFVGKNDYLFTYLGWNGLGILMSSDYGRSWEKTDYFYLNEQTVDWSMFNDIHGSVYLIIDDTVFCYDFSRELFTDFLILPGLESGYSDNYGNLYFKLPYVFLVIPVEGPSFTLNQTSGSAKYFIKDSEGNLYCGYDEWRGHLWQYTNISKYKPESNSWELLSDLRNAGLKKLIIDSQDNFYMACSDNLLGSLPEGGLWRSSDKGLNWTEIYPEPAIGVIVDYHKIFAASQNSVFVSTDNGEYWEDIGNNWLMTAGIVQNKRKNLFVITDDGIYRYNNVSLPVVMKNITCYFTDGKVNLSWNTEDDRHNTGFEIERSYDMINWDTRGFMAGNRSDKRINLQYSFTDFTEYNPDLFYRIKQISTDSIESYSDIVKLEYHPSMLTFNLRQNFPNPFNENTVISYTLGVSGRTDLKVYDMLGNEVANLTDEVQTPGLHYINFSGKNLASGIYFYTLRSGKNAETKKLLLLK
jgi:hypothetical protein